MPFDLSANVNADRDEDGTARSLEHIEEPYSVDAVPGVGFRAAAAAAPTPQSLVASYLNEPEVKQAYGIDDSMLGDLSGPTRLNGGGAGEGAKLHLGEEKSLMGTTSVSYQQTYNGLPIWEAGVNVTVQEEPMRVTSSYSSVHQNVTVANEDSFTDGANTPDAITPETAKQLLGLAKKADLTVNGTRALVYRYRADDRFHPEANVAQEALQAPPPTLPLPPVPDSIEEGAHYVVTEVLFSLPVPEWGPLNWRAFVEPSTGAVLYLRAFVAAATGSIFKTDPPTATGNMALSPTSGDALLNPLRSSVPLEGLTPSNGQPQPLSGQYVRLVDITPPAIAAPAEPAPSTFLYSTSTDNFSAVNAYHHCDWLFRTMQGMGFNMAQFWDGTSFPVKVDHRATVGPCPNGICVNAQAPGNVSGTGSDGFRFALAAVPSNGQTTVGIAADVRVVLHEFGHAILWDSVHSPNFGFAHSAGDSLAAIMLDPDSQLRNPPERFATFPWIIPGRRHDRDVAAGWGWGGEKDQGAIGYNAEQILATTHFRLYRSVGGDSSDAARRRMAAREVVYLIFRGTGLLAGAPIVSTPSSQVWADKLREADVGTTSFEGYRGGAYHKVIRWAFEKQGLYQAPGAPVPVTQPGAPPAVDVYIDDGRNGEYQWQPNFWSTADIWNRLAPDGGTAHQTPIVGVPNYAYVRVKNRGTRPAENVVVRGYHTKPGAGLVWPGDWEPMTTAQVNVSGSIAPGGAAVAGPFEWTPEVEGHECLLMAASAPGDRSNIDPGSSLPCAAGPTPEWRLVPFDNNLGQRNVAPVAGGGGLKGLVASFVRRRFWVKNPFEHRVKISLQPRLPRVLDAAGWKVRFTGPETFTLAPGAERQVRIGLVPGRNITAEEVKADPTRSIDIRVVADGAVLGGVSYLLDPALRTPPRERKGSGRSPLPKPPARPTGLAEEDEDDDDAPEGTESAAAALLEQLNLPVEGVQGVRIRRITVDIDVIDQ